jgi:hypothetical protein
MAEQAVLSLVIPSKSGTRSYLNVVAKRTYTLTPGGRCEVAPSQAPVTFKPEYYHAGPSGYPAPSADPDVFSHLKTGTDLVVQGSAYSLRGPVESLDVSVGVQTSDAPSERVLQRLRVFGDRKAEHRGDGNLPRFLPATPFTEMPLTYDRAYGGKDRWADRHHGDEVMEWFKRYSHVPRDLLSSYVYARNPAGKGFLVYGDRDGVEGVELPNIEDPDDLLTAARLCVGHPDAWPRAPVPAGFDWYEQSWFPRIALAGICRPYQGVPTDFQEVRSGLLSEEAVTVAIEKFSMPTRDDRFFHGASPRLVLPALTGAETFVVTGMHPQVQRLEVPLSHERPQMLVEPPGARATEVSAALRSVVIQPARHRVMTVWVGRIEVQWPLESLAGRQLRHAVRWTS